MSQARISIARVAALLVAAGAMGCSALADGSQALSLAQRMAASDQAQTITLVSAPAGLTEGTVVNQPSMVAMNDVALPEPKPSIVTHTEAWAKPFPGASYVSSCPDCGSVLARCDGGHTPEAPSSISFVHTFELPPGFSSPSFSMTTTNDDAAHVYLNGVHVGRAQSCCGPVPGEVVGQLHSDDVSAFRVGANELRYDLENFNPPCCLSMAYVATVTFYGGEAAP
jgi:hypothetical protein